MKPRFLNSVAHFFGPADKPGDTTDDNDTNDDDVTGQDDGNEDSDADDDESDAGDEGDGDADDDEDPDADPDDEEKPDADATAAEKKDWRDRQIEKQHRKIQDAKRRENELLQELADMRAIAEGGEPKPKPKAGTDPDPVATAKAQIRNEDAQAKYDRDCNEVFAAGAKLYPKTWEKMLARLPTLGGVDNETMVFVLATDDPATALHKMASDPDEYERIMDLPLAKRATALAKIGVPPKKEGKRPSDAPQPIVPISGGKTATKKKVNLADDKVSDEDWYAERERQRAARFAKKRGTG